MAKPINRKGISATGKPKTETQIVVEGDYKPIDILYCSCRLEYQRYNKKEQKHENYIINHDNQVYCEIRGLFMGRLKKDLDGKMPLTVYLKIITKLSEAQI